MKPLFWRFLKDPNIARLWAKILTPTLVDKHRSVDHRGSLTSQARKNVSKRFCLNKPGTKQYRKILKVNL